MVVLHQWRYFTLGHISVIMSMAHRLRLEKLLSQISVPLPGNFIAERPNLKYRHWHYTIEPYSTVAPSYDTAWRIFYNTFYGVFPKVLLWAMLYYREVIELQLQIQAGVLEPQSRVANAWLFWPDPFLSYDGIIVYSKLWVGGCVGNP